MKTKEWNKFEAINALEPEGNQELESKEGLFLKNMTNNELKNEIEEI